MDMIGYIVCENAKEFTVSCENATINGGRRDTTHRREALGSDGRHSGGAYEATFNTVSYLRWLFRDGTAIRANKKKAT